MMEYKITSKTAKENSLGVKSASRSQEPKSIAITKLKGTVQRDFGPPTFFSSFEPAWATDQQFKTFFDFGFVFAEIFVLF